MFRNSIVLVTLAASLATPNICAAGRGEGGCSLRVDAPVYKDSDANKVIATVKLNDCISGVTTHGPFGHEFVFERNDGRLHVAVLGPKDKDAQYVTGWMEPADLSVFTFDCSCGSGKKAEKQCSPFMGPSTKDWNSCFLEARERKRADLLKEQGAVSQGAARVAGKYLRSGRPNDFLEINSDGTCSGSQGGHTFRGNCNPQADTIIITSPQFPGREDKATIRGNTITDGDGIVWEKLSDRGPMVSPMVSRDDNGPSIKEMAKWIKRDLPALGEDHIITKSKDGTFGMTYRIDKAGLDDCVLTVRQEVRPDVAGSGQMMTSTIPLRDLDTSKLKTVEDYVGEGYTKNKASYQVSLFALPDRGTPFRIQTKGLGVDKTESLARGRIRVREEASGLQLEGTLRRAAGLCGAPAEPPVRVVSTAASTMVSSRRPVDALGMYVRKGKEKDYIEVTAGDNCRFVVDGRSAAGKYTLNGETFVVSFPNGKDRASGRLSAGVITFADSTWEKPRAGAGNGPTGSTGASTGLTHATSMTNADVIQLVNAGLSELVIANSIRQAQDRTFDLSPPGLVALKKAKVSDSLIVVMQSSPLTLPTPHAANPTPAPRYDSSLTRSYASEKAAAAVAATGCTGIEMMGLYKNEIFDRAMGGGITEWLVKIRNNTGVTKIVVFGWRDQYGQEKSSQVQISGGEIASPRVDMTQARFIAPAADARLISCQ